MHQVNELLFSNILFQIDGRETISRHRFLSEVRSLAGALKSRPEKSVKLFCANEYRFALYFFSSLLAQKSVTIFSSDKSLQWQQDVESIELSEENWQDLDSENSESESLGEIDPKAEIFFYTSGSTGEPKRVKKHFHNLYSEVQDLEKAFSQLVKDSEFYSSVSPLHIYGFLFKVLWPLSAGYLVHVSECLYHEDLERMCDGRKLTFITSPAFLKRLDSEIVSEPALACVFSSGGFLHKSVSDLANQCLGSRPIEVLGSTETGGVAFRQQNAEGELWAPFPTVQVKADPESQLHVTSPYIFEGDFVMGDAIAIAEDGRFELKGRTDRIAKIEDKRVSLKELEDVLLSSEYVEDCAVISLDVEGRQQTAAALVLNQTGKQWCEPLSKNQMNQFFRNMLCERFERIVVPRKYRFVDQLPLNSQSKVNVLDVRSMFL